jgi:hypothetical protein
MSPEVFIFVALAGGLIATVVLVIGGLFLTGQVKFSGSASLVSHMQQRVPELAALAEDQQVKIVKRSFFVPSLLALGALFAFMLIAVFNPPVLNFINASGRSAGLVGIVLLVIIVLPFRWLQAVIVRRGVRRIVS